LYFVIKDHIGSTRVVKSILYKTKNYPPISVTVGTSNYIHYLMVKNCKYNNVNVMLIILCVIIFLLKNSQQLNKKYVTYSADMVWFDCFLSSTDPLPLS